MAASASSLRRIPECGDPLPWFTATVSGKGFAFHILAGHYVIVAAVGHDRSVCAEVCETFERIANSRAASKAKRLMIMDQPAENVSIPDVRLVFDESGEILSSWGLRDHAGLVVDQWLLVDRALRIVFRAPHSARATFLRFLEGALSAPEPKDEPCAPILVVPKVFQPTLCLRLVEAFRAVGGQPSGFMRQVDGSTQLVYDRESKRRSDTDIADPALRDAARAAIRARLVPEIKKAFQFEPTRIERDIVACYDAEERGFFQPHRDNTTPVTAHRRFAVTINLNADEFQGGELRFPEYGPRLYCPPTGAALVFSCSLLHEVTPVKEGRRYAYLPFLYDEAAHERREPVSG